MPAIHFDLALPNQWAVWSERLIGFMMITFSQITFPCFPQMSVIWGAVLSQWPISVISQAALVSSILRNQWWVCVNEISSHRHLCLKVTWQKNIMHYACESIVHKYTHCMLNFSVSLFYVQHYLFPVISYLQCFSLLLPFPSELKMV